MNEEIKAQMAPGIETKPNFDKYAKPGELFSKAWAYFNANGQVVGYAMRFESGTGKQVRPLRWNGQGWESKAIGAPRPLYNLHRLAEWPSAPILVCEGEKAADGATERFPGFVAVTSSGGAQAAAKSDWGPLKGREVTIWPDHDSAGLNYSQEVAGLALEAGAAEVRIVSVGEDFPEKWDLADDAPPGVDLEALLFAATGVHRKVNFGQQGGILQSETANTAATAEGIPPIKVQNEAEVTEEALRALVPHQDFYQRGGELVRVVDSGAGPATLFPVNSPWLRETLSRRARFLGKADDLRLVPDWLPPMILDRRVWPEVPELKALVTVPVFLGDGRVVTEAGFDHKSGIYLSPARHLPVIVAEAPTRSDAEAARDLLFEVVEDFPFASLPSPECHRAAWLAFVLTLVGRFAIHGPVPFGLFDAPSQGSGKGLLVKVSSLIALGAIGPTTAVSSDEEELRKAILPMMRSGDRLGWLDDAPSPFGGRVWNALMTAWPLYSDRILGSTTQCRVPALTVFAVTGNNLAMRGDSTRRVLHIRIEPQVERPEDRDDWRHRNLLGWVKESQPNLLGAALTILRAFHVAGRPSSGRPALGSFEEWSHLVRDAVFWVTDQDATATQRDLGAVGDEGRIALKELIFGIKAAFGSSPFNAGDLQQWLFAGPEVNTSARFAAEALKRGPGELNAKSIGSVLKHARGTVVEGLRLDATQLNRRTTYRLSDVAVPAVIAVPNLCGLGNIESYSESENGEVVV